MLNPDIPGHYPSGTQSPRRLPQQHGPRGRAFVEPGRGLIPTHRELGLIDAAPVGDLVATAPQQVREKEAVLGV